MFSYMALSILNADCRHRNEMQKDEFEDNVKTLLSGAVAALTLSFTTKLNLEVTFFFLLLRIHYSLSIFLPQQFVLFPVVQSAYITY